MSTIMADITAYVPTAEAASIIGCTEGRVCQMARAGELKGQKMGKRAWIILRKDCEKYAKSPQKVGRPRNSQKSSRS